MFDFIEETLENPAFYLLGGGALLAEVIGFIISKKSTSIPSFPLWQFILLIIGTLIAAAIIAGRD